MLSLEKALIKSSCALSLIGILILALTNPPLFATKAKNFYTIGKISKIEQTPTVTVILLSNTTVIAKQTTALKPGQRILINGTYTKDGLIATRVEVG